MLLVSLWVLFGESVLVASPANPANGDLILSFRSEGQGGATDYLVDAGSASLYRDATSVLTLGTFGADLASLYGSGWYSSSAFFWSAVASCYAQGLNSDPQNTIYGTKATDAIGNAAAPYAPLVKNGQTAGSGAISTFIQNITGNSVAGTVSGSYRQSASDQYSYYSYVSAGTPFSYNPFQGQPLEAANPSASVLDLFQMQPKPNSSSTNLGVNIGYFGISSDGTITFTPYALTISGGGGSGSYTGPWNWAAGSGNWDATNNWTSNQVASNGYDVGITGASGGAITNNAVTNLSSLTFSNSAGSYTLTGTNAGQTLTISGGITNNSAANQTIGIALNTTSNQTINAASGNITLGAVSNTAALTMQESSGKAITAGGQISGNGSLIQSGSGTLNLMTSNNYSGGTTLNAGTVVAGNNAAFGSGGISVASNATIAAGASITLTNTLGVSNGATATLNNAGYGLMENGAIGGNGALNLIGAGTTTLNSANSYSGGTTLNGGSVVAGNNASFGTGNIAVSSSATISAGVPNLAITNTMSIAAGQMAFLDTAGNAWTQSGSVSGNGGVSKVGNGTLSFSGANTYSGTTLVSGGTLQVTGSLLGAGAVTVASGGTLSGTGYVGKTTIQSGGTISAGANGNIGNLSLSSLILNGGGSWNWKMLDAAGTAGTGYDTLSIGSGTLDLSSPSLSSASRFTINLQTLSGSALNFDANVSTNWVIANYGTLTGTFSTNLFTINSSGFANGLNGGFGVSTNASGLLLSYTTAFVAGVAGEWNIGSGNLSSKPLITNGTSLLFSGTGGSVSNNAVTSLSGITFATNAGAYTFSGNAITNGGSGIVNNSINSQVISNAITLGSVQTFTAGGGSLTMAGNIGLLSNTLTVAGSNNTLLSGAVTGTAGITKTGSGTLILSGADSFTGGVTISAGSLLLSGGDNRLWTNSSVSVAAGSSLNLGTNSQQLGSLGGSGTVTGQSSATLTLAPSNASSFAGTITGGEAVAVTGSGTMTLSGSNSYTGGTTASGNLVASNASALGASTNSLAVTGSLNLGSQTITQGQVMLGGGTITGGTLSGTNVLLQGGTISANLGGTAAVTQSSGTTLLSGSNSYNGGVAVTGGTLVASNASALASGSVAVNGGTLNLTSVSEQVGSVTLGNGTITGSGVMTQTSVTATNSGLALVAESLAGTGGFTQNGAGTTTLSGSNSFTGGTLVSNGTLVASNARALGGTNANATIAGGKLDLGGFTQQVGSATLTSGSISNGTLNSLMGVTVTGNSNSTISASLAGNGGLSKSGSGTLNLASALPSGSIQIAGGTLQSSSSVIGSATNAPASVTVSNALWTNSGQLTVGGSGSGSLTVGSGGMVAASSLLIASNATSKGTVTIGDSIGAGTLALGNGSITFGAGTGNLILNQRGAMTVSNSISSLPSGKGTITSAGSGTTTLSANNSGFTGTTYLSSGSVALGTNSQLGGVVSIASKSASFQLTTGSSLTSSNAVHAVAGTLTDNSGMAFKDSIKGQVVLAEGGTLNKTYSNTSVAGFGAGIGAGKSFSLLAGSVAGNATLTAKVTAGALDFKGTYSNAIVMSITDPSFSSIKNTIQWYDPATKTWKNTVVGNIANSNKTAAISGMNGNSFAGSFSTFLLQAKTVGILTAAEDTLAEINAMSATQINTTLAKIMGAFGYDNSTKTSWAVINHNSLYSGEDLGSSSIFDEAALNHTLSDPGFAPLDPGASVATVQAVPEPGTWVLMVLGAGAVILGGWRRKAEKLKS